jgi:hypothetical protein
MGKGMECLTAKASLERPFLLSCVLPLQLK